MRFTIVFLGLLLAFNAAAETADATSDEALILAAEKMIQEGGYVKTDSPRMSVSAEGKEKAAETVDRTPPPQAENEIPIVMKPVSEVRTPAPELGWRLTASLALIAIVGGALFYAARRWRRVPDKGGQTARIEMMHQFHIGPRRSVALIRVAGETLLIGITDQNINMLKSIALIDDELEGVLKKQDFNNFLEDEFSIEDVRSALRT